MKELNLGLSNIKVSQIGLGGINFGTKLSQEKSFEILDTYISKGGNFIDTANNYAVWNGGDGGESERVIGEWISKHDNRKNIVIGTKLGALPKDLKTRDFSQMQGLKRETILSSVEQSLKNLKTDYIDILYLHVDDFSVPQEEVMETLHELIQLGKVKALGCSNFYAWRIENARRICEENNLTFFSVIQQRYSYLTPIMDADFFPQIPVNQDLIAYLNHYQDLTLVAYSPLLKGQYSSLDTIQDCQYLTDANRHKLEELKSVENPINTVLEYITDSFQGSVALITTSNVNHLIDIMDAII
ncbi:MAG: aldo/keto reductase [Coprobacillus sp.]